MKLFASLAPLFVLAIACGGGSDDTSEGAGTAGAGGETAGSSAAGSGTAGTGTAGSGTSGSGTAGSATAGSGTSGSGTSGSGTAGSGTAGTATAGKGGASGSATAGSASAGKAGASGSATAGAAGQASSICDGVATAPFDPPGTCNGPSGQTSKELPSNGVYSTSWFGCYQKADGTIYKDPGDNCEFACGPKGFCPASQPGPECEADLQWFAADADRYGCGAKIRVTNCVNGKAVVLVTLDRGPNCKSVEMAYGAPVLDMSHPAMVYLFDGKTYGGSDKKKVVVEKVADTTPLGPVQ